RRRARRSRDRRPDTDAARADEHCARRGTRARAARGAAADTRGRLPRARSRGRGRSVRVLAHQLAFEQRIFWRSREAAVFVFIFPILLYSLLVSVYSNDI